MYLSWQTAIAFALTGLLIELTPGPNMTYLALVGVRSGRRAGYAAVAGVALGLGLVGIATALGLSAIITASPLLYQGMRWGGVAYMLYLAWDTWHTAGHTAAASPETAGGFLMRGLITNLLNPKAAVFYLAVLPTFIDPRQAAIAQAATLSAVYVLVATTVHALIVTLASLLRPVLANAKVMKRAGNAFAAVLVGVAVWLAWATR